MTALSKACAFIAEFTGSCPLDRLDVDMDCDNCKTGKEAECWEKYFGRDDAK